MMLYFGFGLRYPSAVIAVSQLLSGKYTGLIWAAAECQ